MSKKFKLRAALFGHSLDVRGVTVSDDDSIVSGSRDKTARFWKPNGTNAGYSEAITYTGSKNFVVTVLYLEPTLLYPDGLVLTAGNDNVIYVYNPMEPSPRYALKEHKNAVSCLSRATQANSFLSGSWDSTAKFWSLDLGVESCFTYTGHSAAVWAAVQLKDHRTVTASADKTVGLWSSSGDKVTFLKGHTDCVRGLADFPELDRFVSVSNDASVRVWSYAGEGLAILYGHTNYIYSIARCKAAGDDAFVTSDEDRTVRLWQKGANTETFQLPAQSVWSVGCLSNGDVVTGSSDGVVRVFTRDEHRCADETSLARFAEEVEALAKQSTREIGGYKVSDLPGKEALYDPGKKAGQMKMVREGGGVVAYTWIEEAGNSRWEKVGDVLGGTDKDAADKTVYEGKPYDFVFSVDVEDGKPPLKLPYNKGQDPYQAANEFLARNLLPPAYLEQVVDFILKNSKEQLPPISSEYVDPFTGGSRYTPSGGGNSQGVAGANLDPLTGGNSYSTASGKPSTQTASTGANLDPFTGGSSYTTLSEQGVKYFPVAAYRSFEMGDTNVILDKLKEFNRRFGDNSLDERCLDALVKICHGPPDDPNAFDVLFKLLDWPDEVVFPVLDVVRLAVRHRKNNEVIVAANNGILMQKLLACVNESCKVQNNVVVSLRILCNLFAHEPGEDLVFEHRFDVVENITALGSLNKYGQVGLSTLLLDLAIATLKRGDELSVSVLADVLPDILTKLSDPEAVFRCYVGLGTLLTSAKNVDEVKAKVKTNTGFAASLELHLLGGQSDLENKKRNCARQVQDILRLSF